jgi:Protein of unknown function (DUF3572)
LPLASSAGRHAQPLYAAKKALTILHDRKAPEIDPAALALAALGWILADDDRAQRFLALTGLTPDDLRGGLGDGAVQGAVIEFLAAHEPDLIAAAVALGVEPGALARAGEALRP